jgi:hypothetical protein
LSKAWRIILSFAKWLVLSRQEQVIAPITTPDPLGIGHAISQVDGVSQMLEMLQGALIDLHRLISVEDAGIRYEEKSIWASWVFWEKKGKKLRCEQSRKFLSMIDHRRKESLAHIDGVDNSLRSYRLDLIDIVSVSCCGSLRYQIFRLQHSVQRLGNKPLMSSHLVTKGTVNLLVVSGTGEA